MGHPAFVAELAAASRLVGMTRLNRCTRSEPCCRWCVRIKDMGIELVDRDVLLVIDVQNDFCDGGALAVPGGQEVVPVINRIAHAFRHVILTQDWHPREHHSFASNHPGYHPFEMIETAHGAHV